MIIRQNERPNEPALTGSGREFKAEEIPFTPGHNEAPTPTVTPTEPKGDRQNEPDRPNEPTNMPMFIENSGLVILWPYLERFLETVKLVEERRFISLQHQQQALHQLEYLVRGHDHCKEFDLALDKILCGIPLEEPVDPEFKPQDFAEEESQSLLKAVIRNWPIIKNTSVNGFRRSFLQRDGRLTQGENGFTLILDRKGYDVLLEQLPYSIHIVKLPWMEKPIYVEW